MRLFRRKHKKEYTIYLRSIDSIVSTKQPIDCLIIDKEEPYLIMSPKNVKTNNNKKWYHRLFLC